MMTVKVLPVPSLYKKMHQKKTYGPNSNTNKQVGWLYQQIRIAKLFSEKVLTRAEPALGESVVAIFNISTHISFIFAN